MRTKAKGKIIIVEGIDRVGKTTLVDMLVSSGSFVKIKDAFVSPIGNKARTSGFSDYSYGKCETMYVAAKHLAEQGLNVVIDRMHLTEIVYGTIFRGANVKLSHIEELENVMVSDEMTTVVYVKPTNIKEASDRAGIDQSKLNDLFNEIVKRTLLPIIETDYNNLDIAFKKVMDKTVKHDIYFASPFFNTEQIEREERLKSILRGIGFTVYSPKENSNLNPNASDEEREQVFEDNKQAIESCGAVFAVTDGKDVGTIWEAGYAHAIGKPIIYYAETLGNNQFNLMLAQSGNLIYRTCDGMSARDIRLAMAGVKVNDYKGEIE